MGIAPSLNRKISVNELGVDLLFAARVANFRVFVKYLPNSANTFGVIWKTVVWRSYTMFLLHLRVLRGWVPNSKSYLESADFQGFHLSYKYNSLIWRIVRLSYISNFCLEGILLDLKFVSYSNRISHQIWWTFFEFRSIASENLLRSHIRR